jgi:hypothetical protein
MKISHENIFSDSPKSNLILEASSVSILSFLYDLEISFMV